MCHATLVWNHTWDFKLILKEFDFRSNCTPLSSITIIKYHSDLVFLVCSENCRTYFLWDKKQLGHQPVINSDKFQNWVVITSSWVRIFNLFISRRYLLPPEINQWWLLHQHVSRKTGSASIDKLGHKLSNPQKSQNKNMSNDSDFIFYWLIINLIPHDQWFKAVY